MKTRFLKNIDTNKTLEYPVRKFFMDSRNHWEYFILDCPDIAPDSDEQLAVVDGFEVEIGYIWLSELKPMAATTNLYEVMAPREKYTWC